MVAPVCIFMLTIILAAVYYSVQFMQESLTNFLLYTASIFFSGIFFLVAENVYGIFIAYELLLIPTSLLLYHFSKTTERSMEAVNFMIL
jgi:NADH:ubiquinone oxidoreductase subunit 5 (subunit L)/multisubunit Na+/H+ antiporter MnhA subunit